MLIVHRLASYEDCYIACLQHDVDLHPFVDRDEIRLLKLHPPLYATSPIICTLVHARLSETPLYEALSYVWGTEKNTHSLTLNGESHCVGKNLFEALDALHDGKKQFLWVDALCINQSDPRERGHQVAQMGRIYSHASMVHVWLGPSVPQTALAFERLNNPSFIQFNRSFSPQEFSRLCTTEYLERLWIIQEIALATKIRVNCGHYSAPWESFASMVLENPWALDSIRDSPVTKLCRLRRAMNMTKGTSAMKMSIFMLAETHAHAKCADNRDKIYGLQGFAPSCCRSAISIDYICSAYELCQRILWHEITAHRMADSITNHAVARAGLWGLGHSIRLHKMLVGGALKQTTVTTTPFEAGYMSAAMVPYSDLWKASSRVQAI